MNCLPACKEGVITFRTRPSEAGERPLPDVSRRGVLLSLASGLALPPLLRLAGEAGASTPPALVRPPGALPEPEFLDRCLRCGQCMRICPTGVLQPAGIDTGVEALWTPVLNNRIGTSGCQPNCVACGFVCPTAAIRPFTLDEKLGRGDHHATGPLKMGCAFIDRGRCLPWAMGRPCIVCQENCPVSPKAIVLESWVETLREGPWDVAAIDDATVRLDGAPLRPGRVAGGDYLVAVVGTPEPGLRVRDNTADQVVLARPEDGALLAAGARVELRVRLHRPYIDPGRCTGCGVCEHECPVVGLRAVRITSENESRDPRRSMGRG
jgi:ferredoxin